MQYIFFADPVPKLDANLIVYLQWCYWSHKEKEYPTVAMVSCFMLCRTINEHKFVEDNSEYNLRA